MQLYFTPLHWAARQDQGAAIKALVAAKADLHAKDDVRGGGAGRARVEMVSGLHFTIVVWSFEPEVLERPNM